MPRADGAFIRRTREERDLSSQDLASRVGIHVGTLRNVEYGGKPASNRLLHRLARELDVTYEQLLLEPDTAWTRKQMPA